MRSVSIVLRRISGWCVLGLLFAVLGAGCGPSKTTVTGKVTLNGKAVVYGSVTVIASDGIVYSSPIAEDGSFSIVNVPTGSVKIGVMSSNPKPPEEGKSGRGEVGGFTRERRAPVPPESVIKAWFPIPEKYGDPTSSGLTETIKSGKPLDIDLK